MFVLFSFLLFNPIWISIWVINTDICYISLDSLLLLVFSLPYLFRFFSFCFHFNRLVLLFFFIIFFIIHFLFGFILKCGTEKMRFLVIYSILSFSFIFLINSLNFFFFWFFPLIDQIPVRNMCVYSTKWDFFLISEVS